MLIEQMWWRFLILIVCSYLIGNFNSAITISKFKKRDIRAIGSGNPGTMNMSRNFGLKVGLAVFLLDVLKGIIPTLTARIIFSNLPFDFMGQPVHIAAQYCSAFFVVFGHIFPAFYKFKGGKGIASSIGALFVCEGLLSLTFCACALIFIFVTKAGSMGSFIATAPSVIASSIKLYYKCYISQSLTSLNILSAAHGYYVMANMFMLAVILLTWFAHRANIKRLLAGDEHETNWLQMLKDAKLKKKANRHYNGQ